MGLVGRPCCNVYLRRTERLRVDAMNMNFQTPYGLELTSVKKNAGTTHRPFNEGRSTIIKQLSKRLLLVTISVGLAYTLLSVSVKLLLTVVGVAAFLIVLAAIICVYALNNTITH